MIAGLAVPVTWVSQAFSGITSASSFSTRSQSKRLLADVWGYDVGGLDTVTVHVRRLRMKIEADPSRPALLRTVWGTGYRLEAGTDATPASAAAAS